MAAVSAEQLQRINTMANRLRYLYKETMGAEGELERRANEVGPRGPTSRPLDRHPQPPSTSSHPHSQTATHCHPRTHCHPSHAAILDKPPDPVRDSSQPTHPQLDVIEATGGDITQLTSCHYDGDVRWSDGEGCVLTADLGASRPSYT